MAKTLGPLSSFVTLAASAAVLAGCPSDEERLPGRYVGTWTNPGGSSQVVTQVHPWSRASDGAPALKFAFFPVRGEAAPVGIEIVRAGKRDLRASLSDPRIDAVPLRLKGDCATGTARAASVRLCWPDGRLTLEIATGSTVTHRLDLSKSNQLPAWREPGAPEGVYNLDELISRARYLNYSVAQEAERVFQAKQGVQTAVGNLLPKLRLKNLVAVVTGEIGGIVELAADLLPFLFPSRWYQWKSARELAAAERESFASLRGNEMLAVEVLYFAALRDQAMLQALERHLAWIARIETFLRTAESAFALPRGSADFFALESTRLAADRDLVATLVAEEISLLAHSVALSPASGIRALLPLELADPSAGGDWDAQSFFREAQLRSHEAASLQHLIAAARHMKGETIFSFLDPSSDASLGFSLPSEIRISRSRVDEARKKLEETYSLVEQQSVALAARHNASRRIYRRAEEGARTARRQVEWTVRRYLGGDTELDPGSFVDALVEDQLTVLELEALRLDALHVHAVTLSQKDRLTREGRYANLLEGLPLNGDSLRNYDPVAEHDRAGNGNGETP